CPGLSGQRERVLQNLCGFAFHCLILPAATVRSAMSTRGGELLIRTFSEVPDTRAKGRRRGRRRQGGLLPPSWGSTPSRVRSPRVMEGVMAPGRPSPPPSRRIGPQVEAIVRTCGARPVRATEYAVRVSGQ